MRSVRLAGAADDHREPVRPGAGSDVVSGRESPSSRFGAGRPQCPHRSMHGGEPVDPVAGRPGTATPNADVLPLPPPRARAPQNARPPLSTSRVATDFATTPGGRKVIGETSVPRCSVDVAAGQQPEGHVRLRDRLPRRPTCGIWIRWSISASRAAQRPPRRRRRRRSQPAGSSPQGNRETCSTSRGRRAPSSGDGCGYRRRERWSCAPSTTCTTSQPSAAIVRDLAAPARSCRASTGAGTGRSRLPLRSRQHRAGVSTSTATAGTAGGAADLQQSARRRAASSPSVSTTVVRPRPPGPRRSGRAPRTRPRWRRDRPARCRRPRAARPTTRSRAPGTAVRPVDFPAPAAPTSTTSAGSGRPSGPCTPPSCPSVSR